jgi:hypothetical protein
MHEAIEDSAVERGGRATSALAADDETRLARPLGADGDRRTGSRRGPRSSGRRVAVAVIVATVAVGAVLWARDDGGGHQASAASPTTASEDLPAATTAPPIPTTEAVPVAPAVVVAAADPAPVPEPVLGDGRHPVYLTEVDVAGATVEFDLLQYLVGADAEAYEAAHPSEYVPGDDYSESPFHNDNPRLRRLAFSQEAAVLLQGESVGCGINGSRRIGFAELPDHLDSPIPGRLGLSVFWLTVQDGNVIYIEETQCAG